MKNKSVKDIKELLNNVPNYEYESYLTILKCDSRKSVRDLALKLENKIKKRKEEFKKLETMIDNEKKLLVNEKLVYCGTDEAGRGPLCGPIVSACVIMNTDNIILGVKDSKKIPEAQREALYDEIIANTISYGIGISDNIEIDKLNILNATFLSMRRAIENMPLEPDVLLVDGNMKIPDINITQKSIVSGDDLCYSIACASIIAKVTRDRILRNYDNIYPEYDLKNNKGYGTKSHYEAIRKHGITQIHRKTFLKFIDKN